MCPYIHSEYKACSISGPLFIQMPGAAWLGSACSVCYFSVCIRTCGWLVPSKCACVFMCVFRILSLLPSHFETLQVLRSMSLGISYSPQQHRGTKWLMDRWRWDEGRCGNGGVSYKSRGITHACTHNAHKYTTARGEDERRAGGECVCKTEARLCVWVELCPMCLGALERFHAPISNETHRPRHMHTNTHTLSLPSYPYQTKKKNMAQDRQGQQTKDNQRDRCIY